jgi:hypothetical protein
MTPRERLIAALTGRKTDRTPIWLLFPYHAVGYYVDVRNHPKLQAVHQAAMKYAMTLDRRGVGSPLHKPEVTSRHERLVEGDTTIDRHTVSWKGRSIFGETRHSPAGTTVKKLLTSEEDLEFYCSLPIETDEATLTAAMAGCLPQLLQERAELPLDAAVTMMDLGEPINAIYHAAELTEYPVWSLTRAAEIEDYLQRAMQRLRVIYRWCLQNLPAEVYFLVGSELASPPMVSRKTFQRWIVPYARELIAMIHDAGKLAIQHYHGKIHEILPDFLDMAPDGLHTIESPPTGDCPLAEAFEVVGDKITLIGNVQYDEFRSLTPAQMKQAVRDVLEIARGKRFILSPSAGPYDNDVNDRVVENYLAFLQAGWEFEW